MITEKEVEHIAKLARLTLSEEEKKTYTVQLERILSHMEELNGLDTSRVPPTANAQGFSNVFREDKESPFEGVEKMLSNASRRERNFFRVKKVIE